SGKSTMLKIVAGVLEPTTGSCVINGNIAPLIELGAGFDLELTARENIYLNGALLGYSKKFIEQHFAEIVDFAEIEQFLDMPMKNYSSGMVARVAFAIATVIIPDILIVDEVLSVGDFMFQQKCEDRITNLIKDHHVTVLIVSHNNDQIERLCNKAIWIEKGHARMLGSAHDVCETYRVLGGRTGSAASEQKVFDTLKSSVKVPEGTLLTIAGEDRYSSAVKLMEKAYTPPVETAIVVSGESAPPCMVASCLSGLLDAPVFLVSKAAFPDISSQALKRYAPRQIIILGDDELISSDIAKEITDACRMDARILRINAQDLADTALRAYEFGQGIPNAWGSTAALSFEGCVGELISIAPYLHMEQAPLFFASGNLGVDDRTAQAILDGAFKTLLVLGDETSLPNDHLIQFSQAGISIVRFYDKNPYHSNVHINYWIQEQMRHYADPPRFDTATVCSAINPFDAFAGSAYAGKTRSLFLLEDPGDLDSVAHAIDYLTEAESTIERLTFLGSNVRFTPADKMILGKAIVQRKATCNEH
ncbi:MAG: cell wall-binding repeat-containing protein, partial [Gordonibacter sp.]|uniref:cell wall-binding repeat-containing protein n=1 Tax=Gordonibacter sp. TaxID=1968902 RepID=UPI002FCBF6D4